MKEIGKYVVLVTHLYFFTHIQHSCEYSTVVSSYLMFDIAVVSCIRFAVIVRGIKGITIRYRALPLPLAV